MRFICEPIHGCVGCVVFDRIICAYCLSLQLISIWDLSPKKKNRYTNGKWRWQTKNIHLQFEIDGNVRFAVHFHFLALDSQISQVKNKAKYIKTRLNKDYNCHLLQKKFVISFSGTSNANDVAKVFFGLPKHNDHTPTKTTQIKC